MSSRVSALLLVLAASCCAAPTAWAERSALLAGAATVDVTPGERLPMWGYSDRAGPAQGTLDPLLAKIVVFEWGEQRVGLITLDLGRTPDEQQLANLARTTAERSGVGDLFVTASHTHQAPSLEQYGDAPNTYVIALLEKLADGVAQAAEKLEPVTIALQRGEVDLAHNRRKILPDGRVAMQWRNVQRDPTEPVDREVTVVTLQRSEGAPLAVLVHYACHPVVLGPDNDRYSADYVGAMRSAVESQLDTTCLFLQGACGDINPYVDKTPVAQGGIEAMQQMGRKLGEKVLQLAAEAQPLRQPESLEFEQQLVKTRLRWDINDPEVRAVLGAVYGRRFNEYLAPRLASGEIPLTLTTLLLGPDLALVGMPGEVFVRFQLELKQQSPVPNTLLVGYTHGYHAYFPTIRDAALGGYGGKTATYVDVGTAERLRDQALVTLYRLKGHLPWRPLPEDFRLMEWDDLRNAEQQEK